MRAGPWELAIALTGGLLHGRPPRPRLLTPGGCALLLRRDGACLREGVARRPRTAGGMARTMPIPERTFGLWTFGRSVVPYVRHHRACRRHHHLRCPSTQQVADELDVTSARSPSRSSSSLGRRTFRATPLRWLRIEAGGWSRAAQGRVRKLSRRRFRARGIGDRFGRRAPISQRAHGRPVRGLRQFVSSNLGTRLGLHYVLTSTHLSHRERCLRVPNSRKRDPHPGVD